MFRSIDRQCPERVTDEVARSCPQGTGVTPAQCPPAGAQRLAALLEQLECPLLRPIELRLREDPLDGVLPQVVDPVPTVIVAMDERHRVGQAGEVDRLVAGDGLHVSRGAPAERSERQQCSAVSRRQGGDDLLQQQLRRRSCRCRQPEADQRRPPGQRRETRQPVRLATAQLGDGGRLVVGEGEVGDGDVDDLSGGAETGERDRRLPAAREHEMDMGRKGSHEVGEESGAGRPVRHLVDVVEHHADVERSELAEAAEDALHRIPAVAVAVEGGEDGADEVLGVAIIGFARHPGIDAAGVSPIGPNGLGQQG